MRNIVYKSRKASNLFELLLHATLLGRFDQWFDCFTILFGVSSSILIEEYKNLEKMVQLDIEERTIILMDSSEANVYWIKELVPTTSRKGNYYD